MYLLFDIGGTKMRLAVSSNGRDVGEQVKLETPKNDFDEGVRLFLETAYELAGGKKFKGVAGGIAGPLDQERSSLINSPNIPGWVGRPLKREIENALECPVVLENDAALAGLGEALVGAGKGEDIVAYITVSTGVGGVRITSGAIDRSRFGFEPGHQIVDLGTAIACPTCELRGHLQGLVSGTAFLARYGKPPYEVEESESWEEAARTLAVGLNNVAVFWSPDVIVLGGSMMVGNEGPTIPLDMVEEHFNTLVQIFPQKPGLRLAELGDDGGLYGALAVLKKGRKRTSGG